MKLLQILRLQEFRFSLQSQKRTAKTFFSEDNLRLPSPTAGRSGSICTGREYR